jgi:hypothetical protein
LFNVKGLAGLDVDLRGGIFANTWEIAGKFLR